MCGEKGWGGSGGAVEKSGKQKQLSGDGANWKGTGRKQVFIKRETVLSLLEGIL